MKHPENIILLWFAVVAINTVWQLLETLLYGEIQTRLVDDVIVFFWVGAIVLAYLKGRKDAPK